MKKYEYKEMPGRNIGRIIDLKSLGQEGWELCGITDRHWIFKREISGQDVHIGLLISCAYARGVANLQHRTVAEFAQFVEDVISSQYNNDKQEYKKYLFDFNSRDAIETWIEKFHEYCCESYGSITKQIINDIR